MDIDLYYVEEGKGFPLILLHGNGESSRYFSSQIKFFKQRNRVIAIDTRGHGCSPEGVMPFTISQFADDLYSFMKEEKIEKSHILGFSDGGNIALIFALRHPDMVEKLVLNGANLNPGGVQAFVQVPIIAGYLLNTCLAVFSKNAAWKRDLLRLMVKEPHIPPESLQTLTMPVLVIVGNRDMIRHSHSELICKSLPDGHMKVIPGDHFIAAKEPERFNFAVDQFLSAGDHFSR